MQKTITRNGFEITVTDNVNRWFHKADKKGVINDSMYDITMSMEEYGTLWGYVAKHSHLYPQIIKGKQQ